MRRLGAIIAVLGLLLMAGAAVLRFVVLPGQAQLPGDTNVTRTYNGMLRQAINPQALQSGDLSNLLLKDVRVTINRTVKVLDTSGSKALVSDTSVMKSAVSGQQLFTTERLYTVDRTSLQAVSNFTKNASVIPAKGLTVSFPFSAGKHQYTGWVNDTQSTTPITYQLSTTRDGADVYRYAASPGAKPITDKATLGTLPTSVPKALLTSMVGQIGLPAAVQAQLAALLPKLPDPVPISYTYAATSTYDVAPATGSIVSLDRSETRQAVLDVGGTAVPLMPVFDVRYWSAPASVSQAADDAKSDANAIWLWGTLMPIVLGGVGVLLVLVSIPMMMAKRRPPAALAPERQPVTTG